MSSSSNRRERIQGLRNLRGKGIPEAMRGTAYNIVSPASALSGLRCNPPAAGSGNTKNVSGKSHLG